jgi:hypothetical protein
VRQAGSGHERSLSEARPNDRDPAELVTAELVTAELVTAERGARPSDPITARVRRG